MSRDQQETFAKDLQYLRNDCGPDDAYAPALDAAIKLLRQPAPLAAEVPLNDDTKDILGWPCFTLIEMANWLRDLGHDIPNKAEAEQAACLHWMLNLYLKHGPKWKKAGNAELAEHRSRGQG